MKNNIFLVRNFCFQCNNSHFSLKNFLFSKILTWVELCQFRFYRLDVMSRVSLSNPHIYIIIYLKYHNSNSTFTELNLYVKTNKGQNEQRLTQDFLKREWGTWIVAGCGYNSPGM